MIVQYENNRCDQDYECGWVIRLGIMNFYVTIKYIAEYKKLTNHGKPEEYRQFLESVKNGCAPLPRFIHAIT